MNSAYQEGIEAGLLVDARIGESLFGWRVEWNAEPPAGFDHAVRVWAPGREHGPAYKYAWCDEFPQTMVSGPLAAYPLPAYSSDMGAAWLIVEELHRRGYVVWVKRLTDGVRVDVWGTFAHGIVTPEKYWSADAPTAPPAICLAALKAVASSPKTAVEDP